MVIQYPHSSTTPLCVCSLDQICSKFRIKVITFQSKHTSSLSVGLKIEKYTSQLLDAALVLSIIMLNNFMVAVEIERYLQKICNKLSKLFFRVSTLKSGKSLQSKDVDIVR